MRGDYYERVLKAFVKDAKREAKKSNDNWIYIFSQKIQKYHLFTINSMVANNPEEWLKYKNCMYDKEFIDNELYLISLAYLLSEREFIEGLRQYSVDEKESGENWFDMFSENIVYLLINTIIRSNKSWIKMLKIHHIYSPVEFNGDKK